MTMTLRSLIPLAAVAVAALSIVAACLAATSSGTPAPLPKPTTKGGRSLAEVLAARRSVRRFLSAPVTGEQIGQLCWAAQGITDSGRGLRAAPSAGAIYPLELYVATAEGVQHYLPADHALAAHLSADVRKDLAQAALGQPWVAQAPVVMIIAANPAKMAAKYRDRTERYVDIEVGHAGQNILLQAVALGLGAVPVGAFDDDKLNAVLKLPEGTKALYLIPVGVPAE